MHIGDLEGTVDCCNPNDWGSVSLARAFGGAVSKALGRWSALYRPDRNLL